MFRLAPRLHEIQVTDCTLTRVHTSHGSNNTALTQDVSDGLDQLSTPHYTIIGITRPSTKRNLLVARRLKSFTAVRGVPELLSHLTMPLLLELTASAVAFSNIITLMTLCSLKRLPGMQSTLSQKSELMAAFLLSASALRNEFVHSLDPFPVVNLGALPLTPEVASF